MDITFRAIEACITARRVRRFSPLSHDHVDFEPRQLTEHR